MYYEKVHGATMGSHICHLVAYLFIEDLKARCQMPSVLSPILPVSGPGMWMTPLSSTRQNTPTSIPSSLTYCSQQRPLMNKKPSPSGHISFCRTQWLTCHLSLQETHTHGQISTLGQPSEHLHKIQCIQHPHTNNQDQMFRLVVTLTETTTHQDYPRCNSPDWFLFPQTTKQTRLSTQCSEPQH